MLGEPALQPVEQKLPVLVRLCGDVVAIVNLPQRLEQRVVRRDRLTALHPVDETPQLLDLNRCVLAPGHRYCKTP